MRPDHQAEALRRATERLDYLEGFLAGVGLAEPVSAALAGLQPQGRALVGLLHAAYPHPVSAERIAQKLPNRTLSANREPGRVRAQVFKVRAVLGQDAIVHVLGVGYRLGDGLKGQLEGERSTLRNPPPAAS